MPPTFVLKNFPVAGLLNNMEVLPEQGIAVPVNAPGANMIDELSS